MSTRETSYLSSAHTTFRAFAVIGALGVIVNTLVLVGLRELAGLPLWLASLLATEAALLHNWLLQRRAVLQPEQVRPRHLWAAHLAALASLLSTWLALSITVDVTGLPYAALNVVVVGVISALNYFLFARWVWLDLPLRGAAGSRVAARARSGRRIRLLNSMTLLAVIGGAYALRAINLDQSFNIFIDEITYLRLGESVAATGHVTLYGETFYLHPPAFFFVTAAFLRLFEPSADLVAQLYAVRHLNAAFAAATAGALWLVGYRVGGRWAALGAALLFMLDAFVIKQNSLIMIETTALWWVLAGYLVILGGMPPDQPAQELGLSRLRPSRLRALLSSAPPRTLAPWRMVVAGLLFGLALLSKDMTAFLTLLPLLICGVLGWALTRRAAALIGLTTALAYLPYPLTILAIGDGERFANQKLRGLLRLIGTVQETGFNRHGGPSLVEAVAGKLQQLGTTYLVLLLGAGAIVVLVLAGGAMRRLLAVWTASAYAMLAYCVLFGTLEEQFLYFLMIPAVLAVGVAATLLVTHSARSRLRGRMLRGAIGGLLLFNVGWGTYQWWAVHTVPDNVYEQVLSYVGQELPEDARVAATSETAQFLLEGRGAGPWGKWVDVAELERYQPRYLLVSEKSLDWDYGAAAAPLRQWVAEHGTPILTVYGRADQQHVLYRLPAQP